MPVVALSQLSRAPEQRTGDEQAAAALRPARVGRHRAGRRPRSCSSIRQEVYDGAGETRTAQGPSLEGKAEIIIGKQRNGPTGTVNLFFHKQYTRFENYAARQRVAASGNDRLGGGVETRAAIALVTPKAKTVYRCTECGADHPKWQGRCDVVRRVEHARRGDRRAEAAPPRAAARARRVGRRASLAEGGSVAVDAAAARGRRLRGAALDDRHRRVRLRARRRHRARARWCSSAASRASASRRCCCRSRRGSQSAGTRRSTSSGEESPLQVKLRADRLGDGAGDVTLLSETLLETILATAAARAPARA